MLFYDGITLCSFAAKREYFNSNFATREWKPLWVRSVKLFSVWNDYDDGMVMEAKWWHNDDDDGGEMMAARWRWWRRNDGGMEGKWEGEIALISFFFKEKKWRNNKIMMLTFTAAEKSNINNVCQSKMCKNKNKTHFRSCYLLYLKKKKY